ncbi:MAG: alkaline phosphatase [Clostridia bacterium]|nr:alkaline phosphatase [Clostridia bacterium]
MKIRFLSIVLALLMIALCFAGCKQTDKGKDTMTPVAPQAEEEVKPERKIKNIIFLIPDGAGYPLYDFANDVKVSGGFLASGYEHRTPTTTDPMTMRSYLAGSMTTLNFSAALTDSAAAGTAMATGYKTHNGRVGINPDGKPIANVLEAAQSIGMSTGLVATYEWMHATPASFSAHVMERTDYRNLYQQIENQGIDVVLGSGYGAVEEYATIDNALDRGYTVVKTRGDLEKVKPGDKIWGDATNDSSPYDINLNADQPTLAQMTQAAITALSDNENGFFLMVEGSKIDTGGHANDAVVTTSEYLAFDAAFKVAVDFASERTDTVVLAVPDHDTGAMKYDEIENLIDAVAKVQDGVNPETIGWGTTSHSTQQVGVWMYVPEGVDVIEGLNSTLGDTPETRVNFVIDNTDLAPYIAGLLGVDLDELTKELFVDVTDIGRYSSAVGKFTFNNGNKYVYRNQSEYFEDGKKKSLDGMVTVEANGRFYVPSCLVTQEDLKHVNKEGESVVSGSGTKNDPFIIDEEWKFIEFTGALLSGNDYSGKYFLQTKDLNLVGQKEYPGVGSDSTFAGVYDGGGHEIKVNLVVKGDQCIFPYVSGTVMNLGTRGKIFSTGMSDGIYTAGIARSVRSTGKIINCYSMTDLNGQGVCGIASSNYGLIENCYFGGKITARGSGSAIASTAGGAFVNCYYDKSCGRAQSDAVKVSEEEKITLADTLNGTRESAAKAMGESLSNIKYWKMSEDGEPVLYSPVPTVSKVVLSPKDVTVNRGDGVQFSAVVEGEFDPSQEIVWSLEATDASGNSVLYEDGFLYIDEDETAKSFTVVAKSGYDGSVTDITTVIVGDEVADVADGTRARPYLITCQTDLLGLTNVILSGNNLSGLYFEQVCDLDMTGVDGYNGIPSSKTFDGIYNGNGYVIKVDIDSQEDNSPFGTVSGMLLNVSTSGTVNGVTRPAGVVRKVTNSGKIINCFSDAVVTGTNEAAGVVRSVYGVAANCYFAGSVSASSTYPCTFIQDGGTGIHNYSVGEEYKVDGDETIIKKDELTQDGIVKRLNNDRSESACVAGIAKSLLCDWEYNENTGAVLVRK